jgi:hypothetical protein
MNYVDGIYVVDDLTDIKARGHDIEIDWLSNTFTPKEEATPPIIESINHYCADLERHLKSQDVDLERLKVVKLFCPARGRNYMWAEDDRGKEYKIFIS